MNFKSRLNVAMNPDLKVNARIRPFEFSVRGGGKLDVTTGPIHAEVGVVPVRVALPFMRGRRVVLASFGPFDFTMKPITFSVHSAEVRVDGKIGGEEEIDARLDLQGKCRSEIEIDAEAPVKSLKTTFEGVFEE
jgi:hypothetical protein